MMSRGTAILFIVLPLCWAQFDPNAVNQQLSGTNFSSMTSGTGFGNTGGFETGSGFQTGGTDSGFGNTGGFGTGTGFQTNSTGSFGDGSGFGSGTGFQTVGTGSSGSGTFDPNQFINGGGTSGHFDPNQQNFTSAFRRR